MSKIRLAQILRLLRTWAQAWGTGNPQDWVRMSMQVRCGNFQSLQFASRSNIRWFMFPDLKKNRKYCIARCVCFVCTILGGALLGGRFLFGSWNYRKGNTQTTCDYWCGRHLPKGDMLQAVTYSILANTLMVMLIPIVTAKEVRSNLALNILV